MTKQEEIRKALEGMQFLPDEFEVFEGSQTWSIRAGGVRKILNKLHSQGVVIKVDMKQDFAEFIENIDEHLKNMDSGKPYTGREIVAVEELM
ncbi:MAG: hypothetical protein KAR06_04805 [Deltaproteobacteria bacterium]|nr:hypothetical protein [Deltaproteobacteria bacterium]